MRKIKSVSRQSNRAKAGALFFRADRVWDEGHLRSAFRLFLSAAKAGDVSSQLNVGYFYYRGVGLRRDRKRALYWYKRAYRRGNASAAKNIGIVWRDSQQPRRALSWFHRATKLGDDDANLEIGKHYLQIEHDPVTATSYLELVLKSDRVSESSQEEASRLLGKCKRLINTRSQQR